MDVEETIKFILESQTRAEARWDKADIRADKADARMDRADARADRADARMDRAERKAEREMASIRKLILQGMRSIAELSEAQKETNRELRAFIKSQRNGGNRGNRKNGH